MARARNIKPGFFKNELLAELPALDRLLFMGLWCLADREGRVEDRSKRIKMELFPCDDYSVEDGLARLAGAGFLHRYTVGDVSVISIDNFLKHQSPHGTEKDSELPDVNGNFTVHERSKNGCVTGKKHSINGAPTLDNVKPPLDNALIPDSLIPDSLIQEEKPLVPSADDTSAYSAEFEAFWAEYPKREGGNSKKGAFKAWNARLRSGVKAEDLILSAKRYADQMQAKGNIGTSFVKQAATFLGPDEHWREALASNIHPLRTTAAGGVVKGDSRTCPPLTRKGDFEYWNAIENRWEVRNSETHDPATGYAWSYLKSRGQA